MIKIYPDRWRNIHPTRQPLSTDQYYSRLATRVAEALEQSLIYEAFDSPYDLIDTAIGITAWFEDIISELGIWHTVNEVCQQRYSAPLPFFDTSSYYPNEPNVQDLQFLLWDAVQTLQSDHFINPENPAILDAAEALCQIFDNEYPTAPATDEMSDYLHNEKKLQDYWYVRKVLDWLSIQSYIGRRQYNFWQEQTAEQLESMRDKISPNILSYTLMTELSFRGKHNILSMTPLKWLAMITGKDYLNEVKILYFSYYLLLGENDTQFEVRELATDKVLYIEKESFHNDAFKQEKPKVNETVFYTHLASFCGRLYQIGLLIQQSISKIKKSDIDEIKNKQAFTEKGTHELFLKASGGKPAVFCKDADDVLRFYKKMKIPFRDDTVEQCHKMFADSKNGIALVGDLSGGIGILPELAYCICSKDNPFYDKQKAMQEAYLLLLSPDAIPYGSACALIDNKMLPDAGLSSLKGDDYGRQFLQRNAQFVLDYMFSCNRQDDIELAK